jgi:hypothetical protein
MKKDFHFSTWLEACNSNPMMGGSNGAADIMTFQLGQKLGTLIILWADQMMQQNF